MMIGIPQVVIFALAELSIIVVTTSEFLEPEILGSDIISIAKYGTLK